MAFKSFSKDYTSPSDQAWRTGKSPDNQISGPNKNLGPESFRNNFITKSRKNPDFDGFYQQVFGAETAQQSQDKLDNAFRTNEALFTDERNNALANDFLSKYSQGVSRGLIEEDRAVFPENLGRLVTENAIAGSNLKDPNTTTQFPGTGGIQI